ncbi:MAG: DUF4421 domain-containing protein [Bacteroidales bacterium]|nr:DUF4421 domain-containing protein [Bacteroidales bacterium]
MKLFVAILVAILFANSANAQVLSKIDSVLSTKYIDPDLDSSYIVRPKQKFTIKVSYNKLGTSTDMESKDEAGIKRTAHVESSEALTVSLKASYKSFTLGFSLNPNQLGGHKKDVGFSLSHYGKRYGFDVALHNTKTLHGNYKYGEQIVDTIMEGVVDQKSIYVNFFWTLNHKQFSFPAMFSQNYIQRRSAGSWLLGASMLASRNKSNLKFAGPDELNLINFDIGGGYGYNWVLGKHKRWLVHLSSIPTVALLNNTQIVDNGKTEEKSSSMLEFVITARSGFLVNFDKWFVGSNAMLIYSNCSNNAEITFQNNRMDIHINAGYRF